MGRFSLDRLASAFDAQIGLHSNHEQSLFNIIDTFDSGAQSARRRAMPQSPGQNRVMLVQDNRILNAIIVVVDSVISLFFPIRKMWAGSTG
jgi:hypothetical protein